MELFRRRYKTHCEKALQDFSRIYWPCEYSKNGERCANTMAGHAKGHQNEHGAIIGSGDYESTFLFALFHEGWSDILEEQMRKLSKEVEAILNGPGDVSEERAAETNHLRVIGHFYKGLFGAEKFQSHAICLCCLREHPEYPLRCGHILCMACIQSFGRNRENVTFEMTNCPLHEQDTDWTKQPWPITIMPPLAGGRILCLDG
jgi:hypothetical protein